jgi:hypothetical protein
MHGEILLAVVVILVLIIILRVPKSSGNAEHLTTIMDAKPGMSYVKLYEGFNYTHKVFDKFTDSTGNLYYRILMPINLKSLDINVTPTSSGNATGEPRGVSIWSVYPGDQTASTEATGIYMDTYTDPTYAFRANSPKYQHVTTVEPGQHVRMELEDPVKRIFMVINV